MWSLFCLFNKVGSGPVVGFPPASAPASLALRRTQCALSEAFPPAPPEHFEN